jgi:hypothetical protein
MTDERPKEEKAFMKMNPKASTNKNKQTGIR